MPSIFGLLPSFGLWPVGLAARVAYEIAPAVPGRLPVYMDGAHRLGYRYSDLMNLPDGSSSARDLRLNRSNA